MFTDQSPVGIQVSRPRLAEGAHGVLRVRMTNRTPESLCCTLGMLGTLTDDWWDTPTVLAAGRTVERRVQTAATSRGSYVVHVSADVEHAGFAGRLTGQIDREVSEIASGAAQNSLTIIGGDGSVIDASQLRLGGSDAMNRVGDDAVYEAVELFVDSHSAALHSATLVTSQGRRLRVVCGERVIIGRDPSQADLVAAEEAVSRVHVEIVRNDNRYVLRHRSRTNATTLNQTAVTEEQPVPMPTDGEITIVLGGLWSCAIRTLHGGEVATTVRRGLIERGFHLGGRNAVIDDVAGWLFTPDPHATRQSAPLLWLSTAVRLTDIDFFSVEDRCVALSAFHSLQEVRLADDGRVLSVSDLRAGTNIVGGHIAVELP